MPEGCEFPRVCHGCIGEEFLKAWVRSEGIRKRCSYCGRVRKSVSLDVLAERIHEALQDHFYLTSSEPSGIEYALASEGLWERQGEPVGEVIAAIAKLDESIAEPIRVYMSDFYGELAARDGEEDPYAEDALYADKEPDPWNVQESWEFFRAEVMTRSRFFSPKAQEALDEVFGRLDVLKAVDGTSAIRELTGADEDRFLYRARVCLSQEELKPILSNPVAELGPPPFRKAGPGRMNAAGISVFYGATDEQTCVAEVRAPVGAHVVIGRFEIIRTIRLLDLDALTRAHAEGSLFDPDYAIRLNRVAFLEQVEREISRPVMPRDEGFDYLPTQAVAEYLANHAAPRVDGILFRSSQTGGEGRNVVLLNHACGVEAYELPKDATVEVDMGGWVSEDDYDDTITVSEITHPKPRKKREGKAAASFPFDMSTMDVSFPTEAELAEYHLHLDPALRLDVDHLGVVKITKVRYETDRRSVERRRVSRGKKPKF